MMWLVLICASFFELAFTVCMKLSNGLKNVKYTILTVLSTCTSIGLLSIATKTLPLGIAYAVWTGLGTLFNVLFGIFVFKLLSLKSGKASETHFNNCGNLGFRKLKSFNKTFLCFVCCSRRTNNINNFVNMVKSL